MEREISSGAMLGIVLLALAAVIGLGFGVFAITKGVANDGTVQVQDSLGAVSTQVFLDYDQKIVTGTQVTSALKQFEGKPYAVLIGTKALQKNGALTAAGHGAYAVGPGTAKSASVPAFINYNALLASDATGAKPHQEVAGADITTLSNIITMTNGSYVANNGFAAVAGEIQYDKETGGIFKTGNAEYVPTASKFQANLIKDPSGIILGIALLQL